MTTAREAASAIERVSAEVQTIVVGHEQTVRCIVGAFIVGGHVLLEGPPGIAKTLLARTVAQALGLSFKRIQFTPDLMPSDVTGVNIFEPASGTFRFSPGPLFADIVLADEINRTPPKTQSALLEAMEERRVTIDGASRSLGEHFFVIATQNPIEHEGTFPLPEAQLDRFFFKLAMSYPAPEEERAMVMRRQSRLLGDPETTLAARAVFGVDELRSVREALRQTTFSAAMSGYVTALVHATREHPDLVLGVSPRGALHLALAAKMYAIFEGRDYVIPDDVKAAAVAALNHRLIFKPEVFESARNPAALVQEVLDRVPVPREIQ